MRLCEFPGCEKPHFGKGYCRGHHEQLYKGRPLTELRYQRRRGSAPEVRYKEVPCNNPNLVGPCHEFCGSKDGRGYGAIRDRSGKAVKVHRYCWEEANGRIPDGLEIDHQCRNRACCNVNHLRVVTHQVNSTENIVGVCHQIHAAKTHCPQGHPYDEENTYRYKNERQCRTCRRERQRKANSEAVA